MPHRHEEHLGDQTDQFLKHALSIGDITDALLADATYPTLDNPDLRRHTF